ncbi:MAG: GNAT family N-acyltransferase [Planctomycetota bacterium]
MRVLVAAGAAEVEAIESFRYEIYVAEMGKPLDEADHDRRRLADAADAGARLLFVPHGGAVVGTMRLHLGNAPAALLLRLQHRDHQVDARLVGTVSKTMVAAGRRGTMAFAAMAQRAYREFAAAGMSHVMLHCRPMLVPLYERLGFAPSGAQFECAAVGTQVCMVLAVAKAPEILRRGALIARAA